MNQAKSATYSISFNNDFYTAHIYLDQDKRPSYELEGYESAIEAARAAKELIISWKLQEKEQTPESEKQIVDLTATIESLGFTDLHIDCWPSDSTHPQEYHLISVRMPYQGRYTLGCGPTWEVAYNKAMAYLAKY
jgi:hypothetical protein